MSKFALRINIDDQGQIILDRVERALVGEIVQGAWPDQDDIEEFLARRLGCGTIPATTVIVVRLAMAALRRCRELGQIPGLRDDQVEAARKVLGWEMDAMGEYADSAREVLGELVDAVMAPYLVALGAPAQEGSTP